MPASSDDGEFPDPNDLLRRHGLQDLDAAEQRNGGTRLNAVDLSREGIGRMIHRSDFREPEWYDAVGYPDPTELSFNDFWSRYRAKGTAHGIIEKLVGDTWSDLPEVEDAADVSEDDAELTSFERDVKVFMSGDTLRRPPLHRFMVLDKLSTVGRYGVLVIGFDEGNLETPIGGVMPGSQPAYEPEPISASDVQEQQPDVGLNNVLGAGGRVGYAGMGVGNLEVEDVSKALSHVMYLTPYSEDRVVDWDNDTNPNSPRFRLPKYYWIDTEEGEAAVEGDTKEKDDDDVYKVHWTRVIHNPQGAVESDKVGVPFLQPFWHELLNIEKILAASAEGYWRAGYSGFQIRPPTNEDGVPIGGVNSSGPGSEEVQEQLDKYERNFQRGIATRGTIEPINISIGSPFDHLESNFNSISTAINVPTSILMGSERADIAKQAELEQYNSTIGTRQRQYAEVMVYRALVNRLVAVGVIRPPEGAGYALSWPDRSEPDEQTKAEIADTWFSAMRKASGGMPQRFASLGERRKLFGWSAEYGSETSAELTNAEKMMRDADSLGQQAATDPALRRSLQAAGGEGEAAAQGTVPPPNQQQSADDDATEGEDQ